MDWDLLLKRAQPFRERLETASTPEGEEEPPVKKRALDSMEKQLERENAKHGEPENEEGETADQKKGEKAWWEMPEGPEKEAARVKSVDALIDHDWDPFPWEQKRAQAGLLLWVRDGCKWAYMGEEKPDKKIWGPQKPR